MAAFFALSILVVALIQSSGTKDAPRSREMVVAAADMQRALAAVAERRVTEGPPLDLAHDVNQTGMIGALFTSTTSTTGNLAAKRTTTNPDMAGLLVHLFRQAGVHEDDYIAVGGSGSFPALVIATLCAAKAMHVHVGLIVSLAASQWGANLDGLTWLDIQEVLARAEILPTEYRTVAASVGGADDRGGDLSLAGRTALRERILASGARLIEEPDLETNVAERASIYAEASAGRPIAAFVNIGGGWANLGTSASVLTMPPGVASVPGLPDASRRGVVHAMAAAGVPVIHLLDMAALAEMYGLPWDPVPAPTPGSWRPPAAARLSPAVVGLSAAYGAAVLLWMLVLWRRSTRAKRRQGVRTS